MHFGAGNIFRAFPAAILNDALNTGKYDRGVIVAESFDYEIIDKAYRPYDNMSLLVCLKSVSYTHLDVYKRQALYDTKADHDVTFAEAMEHGGAAFHTSSVLCRREYCFPPEGLSAEHFGDYPRAVYLCLSGKVHRFKEIMSVYRLFAAGSWTSQNLNTVSQEKQTRTQLWTTEFTTKVYQYCQVTGQSPEITAAAKAVADRDWLRLAVMQRGGGCLLADPALRHDFLQLNAEKKQYILREVWDSWLRKTREKRKKA